MDGRKGQDTFQMDEEALDDRKQEVARQAEGQVSHSIGVGCDEATVDGSRRYCRRKLYLDICQLN